MKLLALVLGAVLLGNAICETFEYQAQVSRLMHMIIHSMYTNRDVFLRELLANASDALDKVRIRSLQEPAILSSNPDLKVKVSANKESGTLVIEDTGIGMSRQELVDYLGTIAKSGTGELLNSLLQKKDDSSASNLIGQFGVGFYACFLVADRVTVTSMVAGSDKQYVWESKADAQAFTVAEDTASTKLIRGTRITLFMKEDAKEYLDESKLEDLIKKYSQFFSHKIYLLKHVAEIKESSDNDVSDLSTQESDQEDGDAEKKEDTNETPSESENRKTPKETTIVEKEELMNPKKPLWQRNPKEVTDDEYDEFYKSYFNDHQKPLAYIHFVGEGDVAFRALFFVPARAPYNPFSGKSDKDELSKTVSLYVRRVFTKREQFFSDAMSSFIVGIVDSDELPLNVSRETLQNSSLIEQIRRKSVNKVLDKLAYLAENDKKGFESFSNAFGANVKLEIIQNDTYRKRLSKLLKYQTTTTDSDNKKFLAEYVSGMKDGQKDIFFLAGLDVGELAQSPLLEGFKGDGIEVLLATESLDEYCLQALGSFEEHAFKNVAKEKAVDNKVADDVKASFDSLCNWLKNDVLKDDISEVLISSRLKESSCAVAASQYGLSGHMESVMRAQAGASNDPMLKFMEMQKKVLEVNPVHPAIVALKDIHARGETEKARDVARTIYNGALIRSGYAVKNSKMFMESIDRLVVQALGSPQKAAQPDEKLSEQRKPDLSHDDL